jgi:hypothetical protein
VFSARVYEMIFRGCYPVGCQQPNIKRITHEELIESKCTG